MIKRLLLAALSSLLIPHALAQQAPAPAEAATATAAAPTFEALLAQLPDADYATKRELVAAMAGSGSANVLPALSAMLDGRLFYRLADKLVVVAANDSDPLTLSDAGSGAPLGQAAAAVLKPEDVMATIEKLADLKGKGILTDEEFAAKKAELLKKLV